MDLLEVEQVRVVNEQDKQVLLQQQQLQKEKELPLVVLQVRVQRQHPDDQVQLKEVQKRRLIQVNLIGYYE
jgi:hypothetical protein